MISLTIFKKGAPHWFIIKCKSPLVNMKDIKYIYRFCRLWSLEKSENLSTHYFSFVDSVHLSQVPQTHRSAILHCCGKISSESLYRSKPAISVMFSSVWVHLYPLLAVRSLSSRCVPLQCLSDNCHVFQVEKSPHPFPEGLVISVYWLLF